MKTVTESNLEIAPQAMPLSPHRILVVDDDLVIGSQIAQVLDRSGFRVDTAEDGQEGWETLRFNRYDLLITDNNMPRLSGMEMVKQVRRADMNLPVIFASASVDLTEVRQNPWLNVAAILTKPFALSQLLTTVRTVLSSDARGKAALAPRLVTLEAYTCGGQVRYFGIND